MRAHRSRLRPHSGLLIATVFSAVATAASAQKPTTLKEAYGGHFLIGAAINRTIATGTAVQADNVNRTLDQVRQDIALVKAQFNQIVDENDLKWALVHPRPGADGYDFAPADAFVDFGIRNNMYVVGHTLVWHSQTPAWVFQAAGAQAQAAAPANPPANAPAGARPGRGVTGPLATREELLERMRDHIHTVVGRYKGKVKVWDVVNEALADGGPDVTTTLRNTYWLQIIGPDFITRAFQYAHEADPDAILRYNDYGLENPAKRARLKSLIKELREQGVPVGAIGTQTHINVATTYETMDETLADLATIGLPIHITELDVNTAVRGQANTGADVAGAGQRTAGGVVSEADRKQAETYAGLFRAIMKHRDAVKVVTFWGANDAVSWLGRGRPLLFDGENRPKPAFDAVLRVAAEAK